MKPIKNLFIIFFSISLILAGCTPAPTVLPTASPLPTVPPTETFPPTATATVSPTTTATQVPFPALTLKPGNFYFSLDGKPSFIYSRNMAGYQVAQYYFLLYWSKAGGARFVRIQLDSLGMGYTSTGGVDSNLAATWDQVLDKAQANGIYVLPTFTAWYDWNAGAGYSTWKNNPLNQANGGPVKSPD